MIQLKDREKKFIIIGIIIIAASLAYAQVFYPLYINIKTLRNQYDEKREIVTNLTAKKVTVEQLEQKVDQDMEKLKMIEQNLPKGKNIHTLVWDLETFVAKNHLKQYAFAPQDMEDRETYYVLPIKIRVSGNFMDIIGFLKDWESYERMVNITQTRIYSGDDNDIIGEFIASIYILKTEEGLIENTDYPTSDMESGRSDPFAAI